MRRLAGALLAVTFAATIPAAAQTTPAPGSLTTAAQVIDGIQSYWKNLHTYQVPLTMSGSVKVSFISVPFQMDGTEYYRAPDLEALKMNNVPSLAQGFEHTVSSMGTPETWPVRYDITLHGTQTHRKHLAYVLVGTPKNGGNVKTVTMWVNTKTFAIESVMFDYNNGATLSVELNHHGPSPYHLPTTAQLSAKFPQYSGNAEIRYGTYQINNPIPDSVFVKN